MDDRIRLIQQVRSPFFPSLTPLTRCRSVSSFPILLWYTLYQLTKFKGGGTLLSHLRWRAMESNEDVYQRGLVYLVINLVLTELARYAPSPPLYRLTYLRV